MIQIVLNSFHCFSDWFGYNWRQ